MQSGQLESLERPNIHSVMSLTNIHHRRLYSNTYLYHWWKMFCMEKMHFCLRME